MKLRIVDVDLENLPAEIKLAGDEHGAALVVRHGGRPVGFLLNPTAPGATLSGDLVASLVAGAAAPALLSEGILRELVDEPATSSPVSLTIAVCTRDRPALLARCLDGITTAIAACGDGARDVEALVVDNAPGSDLTARAVGARQGVRYLVEPRPGLDFARNAAWQAATGDFVAYVDDDAVPDPGWLDGFRRALAFNSDAGAVTGLVLPLALETRAQVLFERRGGFRRGFLPRRYRGEDLIGDPSYPVGAGIFGAGCNMAIRRSLLESLGGFDEALDTGPPLPGGGDLDMFYRVLRSGHPLVYEPGMAVRHEHRREMRALTRQYYTWGLGLHSYLGKVRQTCPEHRRKASGIRRWWIEYMARTLVDRDVPAVFALAEIAGGVVGMLGAYGRSRARVAKIRERLA